MDVSEDAKDRNSSSDTNSGADGDSDADTDGDTDADQATDTETGRDTDTQTQTNEDTDTNSVGDTDADTDTDTDSDTDTDTDSDTDTDTDSDMDTDSDTVTDSDTDMDSDTDTDGDADTSVCGDAHRDGSEECDDGQNGDDCDGCLNDCTLQRVPCACDDILSLGDDFEDGLFGSCWDISGMVGTANMSEFAGLIHLNLFAPGPSQSTLRTVMMYDFRNRHVAVKVDSMVAIRAESIAVFRIVNPSSLVNDLSFVQQNGTLYASYTENGVRLIVDRVAYDLDLHRFWRLRDLDATLFWETSADGVTWQTLATSPTPFDVENVYVEVYARTTSTGAEDEDESLILDLLGQDGDGEVSICNAPGWVDNFEDPAISANWSTFTESGAALRESEGELVITAPVNQAGYGGYETANRFSLMESATWVKLIQPLNAANSTETEFIIVMDDDNALYLSVLGDPPLLTVYYRYQSSTGVIARTLDYDPAQHIYWKIAEHAGAIYWYTSADGYVYTELYAMSDPFDGLQRLDDVTAIIHAGTWQDEADPGEARFDDFGLPY